MIRLIALVLIATVAPGWAQERVTHELGEFELLPTVTGVLITAPHGTHDANTAVVAIEAARRLGAGYVVARRFGVDGTRINVNRPTEGAGLSCAQEPRTTRAKDVFDAWTRLVSGADAGQPLRLYVEVHGNSNPRSARHIEIATRGISLAQAQVLSEAYPAMVARTKAQAPAYPELTLLVEPLDRVFYTASCAKAIGILATDLAPRAVHVEFPRSAREGETLAATAELVGDIVRRLLGER